MTTADSKPSQELRETLRTNTKESATVVKVHKINISDGVYISRTSWHLSENVGIKQLYQDCVERYGSFNGRIMMKNRGQVGWSFIKRIPRNPNKIYTDFVEKASESDLIETRIFVGKIERGYLDVHGNLADAHAAVIPFDVRKAGNYQ